MPLRRTLDMLSKHIPKKKDGTLGEAERQKEVCFGPSFVEDREGRSCGGFSWHGEDLSFSFQGVRFHHWTGMYPLVEDTKAVLKKQLPPAQPKGTKGRFNRDPWRSFLGSFPGCSWPNVPL